MTTKQIIKYISLAVLTILIVVDLAWLNYAQYRDIQERKVLMQNLVAQFEIFNKGFSDVETFINKEVIPVIEQVKSKK